MIKDFRLLTLIVFQYVSVQRAINTDIFDTMKNVWYLFHKMTKKYKIYIMEIYIFDLANAINNH